jgi:hypothetical protein
MGILLVQFQCGKEQEFERDILSFASDRYGSKMTKNWTCMTVHISDAADWVDLFSVAQYSHLDPASWCDSDAFSTAWDEPTPTGWKHPDRPRRLELASRIGLSRFNPEIAKRAPLFDLVTFINDPLQTWIANLHKMPTYSLYALCHEALHFVEDWSHKQLVIDAVPPWEDTHTLATLDAFIEKLGGWAELKRRYLL